MIVQTLKKYYIIFSFGILIIGCLIGYFVSVKILVNTSINNQSYLTEIRKDDINYHFINPLLFVGTNKDFYVSQYQGLVSSINQYIQLAKSKNQIDDISVYFRDMNTGHWTGINENDKYHPSSMLKVITMIAALNLIQDKSIGILDTLSYEPTDSSLQYYPPNDYMKKGTYSIQDLIESMIINSDNGSDIALLSNKKIFDQFTSLYKIFRLPTASSSDEDFMSPRSYSNIWRALYNASYLSDDISEQALQLLSLSTFKEGIVSGVSSTTIVSHKFGEFTNYLPSGVVSNRELHDCGIIYYPDHPYFLCVMTKGTADFPTLANAISNISRLAYSYVDRAALAK